MLDKIVELIQEGYKVGEKEMFKKLRQVLQGEPVIFDYAFDGVELQWLYEQIQHDTRMTPKEKRLPLSPSKGKWQCKVCGKKGGFECFGNGRVQCEGCGAEHFVPASGELVLTEQDADRCPKCGCKKLFISKGVTSIFFRCLRCQWEWTE